MYRMGKRRGKNVRAYREANSNDIYQLQARQLDQLDTNYFGLKNDHRHAEAVTAAEGRNLIEQTVAYDATAAAAFLNLMDRRDDAIRCNDRFAYHHADEAANLLRSVHPQLPCDAPLRSPEPDARARRHDPANHDLSDLPF